MRIPSISDGAVTLRPFGPDDHEVVQELCSDPLMADTTLTIPNPYPTGYAERWIETHARLAAEEKQIVWAIAVQDELVGSVRLELALVDANAELAYWIGRTYWRNGYATRASRLATRFGFETLGLHRVWSSAFARNANSVRVMQKLGFAYEGTLREHIRKHDGFEDVVVYGMLRSEDMPTSKSETQ